MVRVLAEFLKLSNVRLNLNLKGKRAETRLAFIATYNLLYVMRESKSSYAQFITSFTFVFVVVICLFVLFFKNFFLQQTPFKK